MIRLTGQLVCRSAEEAAIVRQHLPTHIALTLVEPGCLSFTVEPTDNPLIWQVDETFTDQAAFDAHQVRTAASGWAKFSAGIERRFTITTG